MEIADAALVVAVKGEKEVLIYGKQILGDIVASGKTEKVKKLRITDWDGSDSELAEIRRAVAEIKGLE